MIEKRTDFIEKKSITGITVLALKPQNLHLVGLNVSRTETQAFPIISASALETPIVDIAVL